nr:MAG TPA: hypothetical protein [Bacteriophage sp.]
MNLILNYLRNSGQIHLNYLVRRIPMFGKELYLHMKEQKMDRELLYMK